MAELDHWHPVLRSEELGHDPVSVVVAGRPIVVFRSAGGQLGALPDRCPHRGMRLSEGRVRRGRLVCPYHGWSWAPDGSGHSPGNPRARPCAERLDVVERLGAVWVKRPGQAARFPTFDVSGYHETARLRHRVEAPLELVLDNFIEVEHTPAVHWLLGYPLERMDEVQVDVQMSEDAIHVYNRGPQKPMPGLLRRVFGLEPSDEFVDAWVTRFSPVHTVYDHYFLEARTGESRPMALREAVFFNPIDAHRTELFTFIYTLQPPWGRFGLDGLLARGLRWIGELEIRRDVETVARLADKRTDIAGNRLGRFDKPLLAARTRIDRIYRGRASEATDEARDRVTDG